MAHTLRIALLPLMSVLLIAVPAPGAFGEAATPSSAQPAASGAATSGDFAGLVDIGGRRLYLACKGSGTPTVILEAGAGNTGDIWSEVAPEAAGRISVFDGVATFTRVCAYHRPGTIAGTQTIRRSRSDPAPMPRSAGDVVADLRALLTAAGVRPPFVLVGHSFGGLVVRLFASTLPQDDVIGLVLVDAAQEEFWTKLKALVTSEQWQGMTTGTPPELADYHDIEKLDVDASAAEMRKAAAARPLRPLPLIVLSRGRPMELSPDAKLPANFSAEQEEIWRDCQEKLVALVPGAKHVVATKSEHYIQTTEPDLVIAAVRQVVEGARQGSPSDRPMPTQEELANDNNLFISLANYKLRWEEAAEPVKIVGPLHFVGTKGLGVFLFTTPEGHILMNTGMPSSGPMIVESIRKLGFEPEDIKIMINGHAHIDHAGAFAYLKQQFGVQLAVMQEDVPAMESGDRDDFKYGDDLTYPGVKVDRILRDGDTIKMGDVVLTAYLTPGHTRGSTTWVATIVDGGKSYSVAFPDGAGFNPGYRLVKNPSYPGIANDYRRTHRMLEMLKPDIWLAHRNEYYDLEGKRKRAETEGVRAWVDPEGYRRFVAGKKRAFEDQVDREMGVPNSPAK